MNDIMSAIEEAVTHGEEMWEALAHSPIGEAIPVAGHFVKLWRAARDVRASLFAVKLLSFIQDPSLQTSEARACMRERAESQEGKKIGEALFLILERLTDLNKPLWLAKVYAAYLAGEVKGSDLRRLSSAIDAAFGDDLIALISSPETPADDFVAWKKNLAASGLTEMSSLAMVPMNSRPAYNVSELGEMFRKAVRDHS
jgi:hypothetical protein